MNQTIEIVQSIPWFGWVAIVAIVSGAVSGTLTSWMKHRERFAMIQQGMNPDLPENAKSQVPEL